MTFFQAVIQADTRYHSTARCADLALLEPVTRAAVLAIQADAAALGRPLLVFETYRSQERQALLFAQHATQLKNVGVHHFGLACDLVCLVDGEPSWKPSYLYLGTLAAKHGLVWGGSWSGFKDMDHVQRCTVTDQTRLFAQAWYPDAAYDALGVAVTKVA